MIPCPSRQRLLAYAEGRLGGPDGQELKRHVEGCSACREAIAGLTAAAGATPVDPVPRRTDESLPAAPGCALTGEVKFGGMGAVYFGTDTALRRPVAVKVLRRQFADHEDMVARFEAEALVCAQLQHPGIVPVYQVGRLADGRPFYTMKLVKGETLGELLRRRSSPADDLLTFLTYFRGVCEAVGYAHAHNVLHRDLKPANVMVGAYGEVLLMDWGLAKVLGDGACPETLPEPPSRAIDVGEEGDRTPTSPGTAMGTVAYMPPEQAAGSVEEVDRRSDVFGLGAILCTVLTGQPPYVAPREEVVLRQALSGDLSDAERRLSACGADEELVSLTRKCLARSREDRPADAGAVAGAIGHYLAGVEERRQQAEFQRAQAEVKASEEEKRRLVERQKRRLAVGLAMASLLLTLLLAAGGVACLWYWDAHLRVKVQHYAGIVNRFGVKEGVGPLGADEARRRNVSYKVYRRGGLVERVDVVNGLGELTAAPDDNLELTRSQRTNWQSPTLRECRYEYIRNQQGELVEERAFDRNGGTAWALHYTTPTTAHFITSRRSAAVGGPEAAGNFTRPLGGVGPNLNSNSAAESLPARRPEGLPQARTHSGVRYLRFTWTGQGFVNEVRYVDVNGRSTPDDGRVCGVRREYDERGFAVRATFLDAKGRPTLHAVEKFSTVVMERDERGDVMTSAYLDDQGRACLQKEGISRAVGKRDPSGNVIEWTYFGVDGRPCQHKDGNHKRGRKHDERGNVTEETYFGLDDRPCLGNAGFHKGISKYDERGNRTEAAYFGVDDRPCLHKDGYHKLVSKQDERGDVTPLFSLRENAIAKEPGLSYPESWRCVSQLGASMVAQTLSSLPRM